MKIFDRKPDSASAGNRAGRVRSYGVASEKNTKSGSSKQSADKVVLSKDGAGLAEAIRKAASEEVSPPASPARLAELKGAIESGTYEIDTTALAQAIIRQDLSGDGGEV